MTKPLTTTEEPISAPRMRRRVALMLGMVLLVIVGVVMVGVLVQRNTATNTTSDTSSCAPAYALQQADQTLTSDELFNAQLNGTPATFTLDLQPNLDNLQSQLVVATPIPAIGTPCAIK